MEDEIILGRNIISLSLRIILLKNSFLRYSYRVMDLLEKNYSQRILRVFVRYRKGFRDQFTSWTGLLRFQTIGNVFWNSLAPGPVSVSRAPLWFTVLHESNFLLKCARNDARPFRGIVTFRTGFLGFPVSRMDFREDRFEYFSVTGRPLVYHRPILQFWIDR